MAKKTKKTDTAALKEVVANTMEDIDEVVTPEEIKELAESFSDDSNIDDTLENFEEDIKNAIKPVDELEAKVKEMVGDRNDINDIIAKNPGNIQNVVETELKKAEQMIDDIKKEINKIKPNNTAITSWWNGMGYDF